MSWEAKPRQYFSTSCPFITDGVGEQSECGSYCELYTCVEINGTEYCGCAIKMLALIFAKMGKE